ncbi:MAG TPA: FG-GAP-like repeat-containing protein, partial [Balneolaceae bacterium]|nr:FG-GAP-like repeat-containing protein [Balneolaceae bacterium]
KKAQNLDPSNAKILYKRAEELERQDVKTNADQVESLLQKILKKHPENQEVLLELIRVAAKNGDKKVMNRAIQTLKKEADKWPKNVHQQFGKLTKAVNSNDEQRITLALTFLKNQLQQQPVFQQDVAAVKLPPNKVGFMINHFIRLPQPKAEKAPADTKLSFKKKSIQSNGNAQWIKAVSLRGELKPDILHVGNNKISVNNSHSSLKFPGTPQPNRPGHHGIAVFDYNYDFRNDLAFAGNSGFRLYQQQSDSTFSDVTDKTDLPGSIINGSYRGVWADDIDSDGDLDIVLAPQSGPPKVLQNDGDGTFKVVNLFNKIPPIKNFFWADIDGDGDPDAIFLTQNGKLIIYLNDRSGHFHRLTGANLPDNIQALNVSDLDQDGTLDMVMVNSKGAIKRLWYDNETDKWRRKKIAQTTMQNPQELFVHDFDNNGGLDVLLSSPSGSQIWLSRQNHQYSKMPANIPVFVSSVMDVSGDKRLDLIGQSTNGSPKPAEFINNGTKKYHAEILRPRASGPLGDRRINSFGIGSEIEARAGLMYQKKLVTSPLVHIGLGTHSRATMVRIIWPNGSVQAELAGLSNSSSLTNKQSLKGSCPWVFAYNGQKMKFVTDFLWSSPLGLRINGQSTAGVVRAKDRIKIRGNQLKPHNGYYDMSITAELWETHFFDQVALMAVDHPKNTNIFIDERFSIPPPSLKIHVTGPAHPVAKVTDEKGQNVTSLIRKRDGKYLAHFKITKYQGLAKKHYIQINLGKNFPTKSKKPLWLLAYGWVRPTNSSINLALSQSSLKKPQGISVQVPDGHGGWVTAKKNVGFPAGKNKMVMINLRGIFKHAGDHRIRLVTSTETFWDQIRWAQGLPNAHIKRIMLKPAMMKLRYRGYSKVTRADSISPNIPHYNEIAGTSPKWRDLIGFYTRYGNVTSLLKKPDDRYVIMNAGDEMRFRFKDPGAPKKGWKRDFVLIGDGWEKDGDLNTKYSKTVLPLPSHQRNAYKHAPTSLENDPVYKNHKKEWMKYQTRYVTPEAFRNALNMNKNE